MGSGEPRITAVTADPISRFIHTLIPTALVAVVLHPAMAQGQTAADLFNPDVVQEIRLSINSRDYGELRDRYQENTYPGPFSVKSEYMRVTDERRGQSVGHTDLPPPLRVGGT